MSQSHSTAIWQEPAGSGAVPTVAPAWFLKPGSTWVLSTTGAPPGKLFDIMSAGPAELIDLTTEYQLVDTGGGTLAPNAVGVAGAVMTLAGGKYVASAVGAGPLAAQFFPDAAHGKLRLVPLAATETQFVVVRGTARAY